MRAAVCYEFGKPLVVEEVELKAPQAGEVKVRLAAAAICHSDIHLLRGEWGGQTPVIAGHEASGIVEVVGEGVTLVQPGDHVVVSLLRSCGRCFFCATGSTHMCDASYATDSESRFYNLKGDPIVHGIRTAAFAEYTIVDQSQLVSIPKEMPLDRAALLACGVITGYGAVVNTARVAPHSSVVVIGTGGVGLNAVQGAALTGANPVIAVDLLDTKLKAAHDFGASHVLNASDKDVIDGVRAITGRGADYVFVTVGSSVAVRQAFDMIRPGGTVIIVGIPEVDAHVSLPVAQFIFSGPKTITASVMGSTRLSIDVPHLVTLYQQGKLKLDELITDTFTLDEINVAIERVEQGKALRNVISFL